MKFRLLGDVAAIISGQHIESTLYSRVSGATPYLTGPADFAARHPHVSKWTNAPKVLARASDVLVTVKGAGVGKVNWGCDAAIGRQLMAIRPKDASLEQSYLFHFMRAQEQRLNGLAQGATVPGIGRDDLLKLRIPTPPVSEQRRIAEILDKADALRAKRCAALAQLDTLTQSVFLDMFGDPKTNPKRWPLVPFGAVAHNEDAQRVPIEASERHARRGEYPYYGASGIIDWIDAFIFDGERLLIAEDGANLVSRSTPIAFLARGRFWVNNHAHVVSANECAELRYLEHVFRYVDLKPYLGGTAQPKLTRSNLDRVRVPLPSIALQKEFVSRLAGLDTISQSQRASEERLKALSASLQHRAFRGELSKAVDLRNASNLK